MGRCPWSTVIHVFVPCVHLSSYRAIQIPADLAFSCFSKFLCLVLSVASDSSLSFCISLVKDDWTMVLAQIEPIFTLSFEIDASRCSCLLCAARVFAFRHRTE